jgi:hypothetical protein
MPIGSRVDLTEAGRFSDQAWAWRGRSRPRRLGIGLLCPHEFEVRRLCDSDYSWPSRVVRVAPLGGISRVDLSDGTPLEIELTLDCHRGLELNRGDDIFIRARAPKVFRDTPCQIKDYAV